MLAENWTLRTNLIIAVAQPLIVALLLAVTLALASFSSGRLVAAGMFFTFAALASTSLLAAPAQDVRFAVAAMAFLILALWLTFFAGQSRAFATDGIRMTCVVTDVDRQTDTYTYNSPSGTSTSTSVRYRHTLACADPGVTDFTSSTRKAAVGDSIDVYADPSGLLEPKPVTFTDRQVTFAGSALASVLAAAALQVAGVLTRKRRFRNTVAILRY